MISYQRCIYCLIRSYRNKLEKAEISAGAKEEFTHGMIKVLNDKWYDISAPDCARDTQQLYKSFIKEPDPYKEAKKISNDTALDMYSELDKNVAGSDAPFIASLKLAIAGNIIDFAVNDNCDLPGTIVENPVTQST